MTLIIDKKIVTLADTKRLPHWVAKPTQMLGLHHLIPCQKAGQQRIAGKRQQDTWGRHPCMTWSAQRRTLLKMKMEWMRVPTEIVILSFLPVRTCSADIILNIFSICPLASALG